MEGGELLLLKIVLEGEVDSTQRHKGTKNTERATRKEIECMSLLRNSNSR
jgi:hypothetical protein